MTGHFDIALFDVDAGLQVRLGYKRIYCAGRDVLVSPHPAPGTPAIATGSDAGMLIPELRKPDVIGIAFDGNRLDKKAIEKAAEYGKTVFMPVGRFTELSGRERVSALHALSKIFFAAHALRARAMMVTLAGSRTQLLSTAQMRELAQLVSGRQGSWAVGDFL